MSDKRKTITIAAEVNKNKGKDRTNVVRYFPGIVPKWVDCKEEEVHNNQSVSKNDLLEFSIKNTVNNDNMSVSVKTAEENDRRLKRLQQIKKDDEIEKRIEERLKKRREVFKSEVVEERNQSSNKDLDMKTEITEPKAIENVCEDARSSKHIHDDIYLSRQELKQKLLSSLKHEEGKNEEIDVDIFDKEDIHIPDATDMDNNVVCSNSEESSEDEKLLKPVFVSRDDRLTIKEKLQKELEEKANKELELKLKEQKKKETKKLVLSYIQKDLNGELEEKNAEDIEMPDDTDEPDNTVEYENWKIRELKRIKRNEEENLKKKREMDEIERRRSLTDDQRKEENIRLGSDDTLRPFKSKYKFMQKFYKMGVFYQDQSQGNLDHIFNRDYNLPVGYNKYLLKRR